MSFVCTREYEVFELDILHRNVISYKHAKSQSRILFIMGQTKANLKICIPDLRYCHFHVAENIKYSVFEFDISAACFLSGKKNKRVVLSSAAGVLLLLGFVGPGPYYGSTEMGPDVRISGRAPDVRRCMRMCSVLRCVLAATAE
jgi:hypothetical protein